MGIIHRLMDDHCFFMVVHFRKRVSHFSTGQGAGFSVSVSHLLVREGVTVIHHISCAVADNWRDSIFSEAFYAS